MNVKARLAVIATSAGIGSLGLAAGGTAGALAATQLSGTQAAAGLPLGILVAGSAVAAVLISRRTEHRGRASGLGLGYAIGATGALVVIISMLAADMALLLLGSFLLGAGNPAIFLTRYAGAAAVPARQRGRGLGLVFLATAVGAVIGPNLLGPTAIVATAVGLPELAGLYLLAIPAFGLAAALIHFAERGSPHGANADVEPGQGLRRAAMTLRPGARAGLAVLTAGNLVMVGVMAVAPVHLQLHGQELDVIGIIVGIHVLAMFAPAPLTGVLVDRLSPRPVIVAGAGLLLAAGISLAALDASRPEAMLIGLLLLGLGWNASVVGGSALLTEATAEHDRPALEGLGEIAMGLAAAIGTPLAGLGAGLGGFSIVAMIGALAAAILAAGALGAPGARRRIAAAGP